jgi:hypothetical protein
MISRSFGSSDLHHRTIMDLDIEGSGTRPDRIQADLPDTLNRIATSSMQEARVTPADRRDLGDGLRVFFGPHTPKNRIVHDFVHALGRGLIRYNATAEPNAQIRLRAAIHAGELHHRNNNYSGSAVNDTYGLVNSDELRDYLRQHPRHPLALAVSYVVFDGVVRGADGDINPEAYRHTTISLKHNRNLAAWFTCPNVTVT